jgi:acyl-CoA reductase-like NAD-dependent aldehyde dehydrogenase
MTQPVSMRAAAIKYPKRFYIGGHGVDPSSEATIDVVNPSTEEVFLQVAEARETDICNAVSAARSAFDQGPWPRMSHSERGEYIRRIGEEVSAHTEDFSKLNHIDPQRHLHYVLERIAQHPINRIEELLRRSLMSLRRPQSMPSEFAASSISIWKAIMRD